MYIIQFKVEKKTINYTLYNMYTSLTLTQKLSKYQQLLTTVILRIEWQGW